jgi:hypothetical protein
LRTPREVRASLVYVLMNFRKHLGAGPGLDRCSSAPDPVAAPRTWLARVGWLRAGGPLRLDEAPTRAPRRAP